jgi:hypothetical protein
MIALIELSCSVLSTLTVAAFYPAVRNSLPVTTAFPALTPLAVTIRMRASRTG